MNNLDISSNDQFSLIFKGVLIASISFTALGTVTALWDNPFFFRMTPTSGFEIVLLTLQAIMFGVYFSIPLYPVRNKNLEYRWRVGFPGICLSSLQ